MNVVKLWWLNMFWFLFWLESIRMEFCVMWFLCLLVIYCYGDLGILIGSPNMIKLKIDIHLRWMEGYTYLHHCHLDRFMKTKWNWKRKVSWNGNTTMWGRDYHAKICTKVVSKACLSKIIISYYFHTVLLEIKIGKKIYLLSLGFNLNHMIVVPTWPI